VVARRNSRRDPQRTFGGEDRAERRGKESAVFGLQNRAAFSVQKEAFLFKKAAFLLEKRPKSRVCSYW
jgi:hypothetical protein